MELNTLFSSALDHIWFFLFIFAFLIIFLLIKNKLSLFTKIFTTEDKLINDLRAKVFELEKRVEALHTTIQILIDRITAAQQTPYIENIQQTPSPATGRPVLLVYGDDKFGESDRNALRRAGVAFFKLSSGNLEDLRTELQRRRSDGRMYDVVHISAHGGGGNLLLDGTQATGIQLSDVLSGVRVVFLGTCNNQLIADKLIGIVKYVVVVYDDIKENDAVDFTYEFYKRYKVNTFDIDRAFSETLVVMPHISDFVDLRKGG